MRPDVIVKPQPWLWQPRFRALRFLEIHATRGATTPEKQFAATVNWMQSPANGGAAQGWGGSCSYVIDRDGTLGTVLADNQMPTYGAGYGGTGSEWSIDEYGISYEWCQSPAQEEFTTEQYERGAAEYAAKCRAYGIPALMLDVQRQAGPVPSGFVRHDRCENGRKLGKTDPGARFRDDDFIALVREKLAGEEQMTEDEVKAVIDKRIVELVTAAPPLGEGALLRAEGQEELFVILAGQRCHLPDETIARSWGWNGGNERIVHPLHLLSWPEGPRIGYQKPK
jgi:hypothetical protein